MGKWWLLVVLMGWCSITSAERYVVGTESLNFYPHFNFTGDGDPGFARAVFELFQQHSGHEFEFVPLPVKRLYYEGDIDLVYPDHPDWGQYQSVTPKRYFSAPVVGNLGTTWIHPSHKDKTLNDIQSLAIIHGFTPEAWMGHKGRHQLRFIDVPDPESAIGVLQLGRVQATDLEYNVAYHIMQKQGRLGELIVARHLPLNIGTYHLSSTRHPSLIEEFDRFLQQRHRAIEDLKRRFNIVEDPDNIPTYLRVNDY